LSNESPWGRKFGRAGFAALAVNILGLRCRFGGCGWSGCSCISLSAKFRVGRAIPRCARDYLQRQSVQDDAALGFGRLLVSFYRVSDTGNVTYAKTLKVPPASGLSLVDRKFKAGPGFPNFDDKEWMTVDTTPGSPFYGRVYASSARP